MLTSEWMSKTLVDFGFERIDTEVYVFLVLNGPNNALAIKNALGLDKYTISRIIRNLEKRQILFRSQDLPSLFSVISFDRLLNLLSKAKLLEAKKIEQKKMDILAVWFSYIKKGRGDRKIKKNL
jgi:sugar-specific transcriptional regulator TrmB